jgi:hypothetical protein
MRNPLSKLTRRPIRVAVTGLSQAGKTVFLTSLIDHLVQGSEDSLARFEEEDLSFSGRPLSVPPGRTRFPYRRNLEKLRGGAPDWPEPTAGISEFRLELAVRSGTRRKCRRMELHLVDYPGERLLDLPLLEKDFATWSEETIRRARAGARGELSADWLQEIRLLAENPRAVEEADARRLVDLYAGYLTACRENGLPYVQPAALVCRSHQDHAVPLQFCPLPNELLGWEEGIGACFEERYDIYRKEHVRPFARRVARAKRQIVLVDVLDVLRKGVHSYNDTRRCLREILESYGYRRRRHLLSPLRWLDRWKAIDRVAFVATKADQCGRSTRGNLVPLLRELVAPKRRDLSVSSGEMGLKVDFVASHRSTEDAFKEYDGQKISCLRGQRADRDGKEGVWFPGEIPPDWPEDDWDPEGQQFVFPDFLPARAPRRDGARMPHINMDNVLFYMIEDLVP